MSDQRDVHLTTGPPETVLPTPPLEAGSALERAVAAPLAERREAVAEVVARYPRFIDGWAALGDLGSDVIERYAFYRIGYHRGLDALRGSGWRGSGYVRWAQETNRGFLRALDGLRAMAEVIGEDDEVERCALFLRQLDPAWPPAERA
jgi:hypothetical protein